jgi:hypothetical protein
MQTKKAATPLEVVAEAFSLVFVAVSFQITSLIKITGLYSVWVAKH